MIPFMLTAAANLYSKGMNIKNRMDAVNSYNETQDVYKKMNALNDTQGTIDQNFDWANPGQNNQNQRGTPWL